MKSDIQNYLKLQTALINEKAKLEARLTAINRVLGGDVVVTAAPIAKQGGRRTFSAATKAKMAAAQKARWAKLKGNAAPATATNSAPASKKKRKMSAAGKANIRAAVKARWAKVNAQKKSE
jgi:hypothetical protein